MALSFSKEIKIAGFASLEAVSALVFITGVVLTFSLTTDLLQKYYSINSLVQEAVVDNGIKPFCLTTGDQLWESNSCGGGAASAAAGREARDHYDTYAFTLSAIANRAERKVLELLVPYCGNSCANFYRVETRLAIARLDRFTGVFSMLPCTKGNISSRRCVAGYADDVEPGRFVEKHEYLRLRGKFRLSDPVFMQELLDYASNRDFKTGQEFSVNVHELFGTPPAAYGAKLKQYYGQQDYIEAAPAGRNSLPSDMAYQFPKRDRLIMFVGVKAEIDFSVLYQGIFRKMLQKITKRKDLAISAQSIFVPRQQY